jgi:very-short-patch-repair endonuclease
MTSRSRRQSNALPSFEALYIAADARRLEPTRAEAALAAFLDQIGGGALRGEYKREWPVGRWVADFYFPSIRLAIEVDGGYHRAQSQWRRDQLKAAYFAAQEITLLRLGNREVLGDREQLLRRLRAAWREALQRRRGPEAREELAAYRVRRSACAALRILHPLLPPSARPAAYLPYI